MRKFTKEQIRRLEQTRAYAEAVFEGFADPKDGETLLLENAQEDLKAAFDGKPEVENKNEKARRALKEASTTKPDLDNPVRKAISTQAEIDEVKEAFGGHSPDLEEAIADGDLLLETITVDEILEGDGEGFRFKGRAVKVGRRNKNGRRYSKAITERALKEARESGVVLTCRDGHPKKGDTSVSPMIGRVVFGDLQSDNWMPYEATISNTSRGVDIQKLLRDKVIGDVSLRSKGKTAVVTENGETFEDVVSLHFRGLDLVTEGSEQGAKCDEIFNAN